MRYAVVSFLEKDYPVIFTVGEWPLHMTLYGWFESNASPEETSSMLGTITVHTKPMTLKATEKALFGKNQNLSVTRIEKSDELDTLHQEISNAVGGIGTLRHPEYFNDAYSPHVTDQVVGNVKPGESIYIDSLSLVLFVDTKERQVLQTIPFGGT